MTAIVEPTLAPPGAGLPPLELLIGRALFRWRRLRGDRDFFTADFQRQRSAIAALLASCDPETGARRVLIRRPPGLEDSSRYWSIWMTLDHLRIIHKGFVGVIEALLKGVVPPGRASTAAVKPSPEATAAVRAEYEKSCDDLLAIIAAAPDLNTRVCYEHPWFGPLNAAGWHALAGNHMSIHRVQIEKILQGLNKKH